MKASELIPTLTTADENREFWVTGFLLNDDPFKSRYLANVPPTRAVFPNIGRVIEEDLKHVTQCAARSIRYGYESCVSHLFHVQTIKRNGERGAKTIPVAYLYGRAHSCERREIELCDTKEEALETYERMIGEATETLHEHINQHTEKIMNVMNNARRLH